MSCGCTDCLNHPTCPTSEIEGLKAQLEAAQEALKDCDKRRDIWMRSDLQARDYAIKLEKENARYKAALERIASDSYKWVPSHWKDIAAAQMNRAREALSPDDK